jgi:hypothetical protein
LTFEFDDGNGRQTTAYRRDDLRGPDDPTGRRPNDASLSGV